MSDFDPFDPVNTVMRSLHKSNMLAAKDVQIAELEAENARLKAEVERLRASSFVTAVPVEQYEKLKAEVERLRKAGDAMDDCISTLRHGRHSEAVTKAGGFVVCHGWRMAKSAQKGGQS